MNHGAIPESLVAEHVDDYDGGDTALTVWLQDPWNNIDAAGKMIRDMLDGLAEDAREKKLSLAFQRDITYYAKPAVLTVPDDPKSVDLIPPSQLIRAVAAMWDEGQNMKYAAQIVGTDHEKCYVEAGTAVDYAAPAISTYYRECHLANVTVGNLPYQPWPDTNELEDEERARLLRLG
jgi:hypothetical protein